MDGVEQVLAEAQQLQDAGRLAEAEISYRRVIESSGDSPLAAEAYDGLAAVLQDRGNLDQAIEASKKCIELRNDADAAYALGDTLERLARIDDAIWAFQRSLKIHPKFAEAHARLGALWLATDRPRDAASEYQAAVDAQPKFAEAHCNLANARLRLGDEDGALESARRAIELKPELAEAHNVLGTVLRERRRPADAMRSFVKAIRLKPDYGEALNNMGSVVEQEGKIEEAGKYFEHAARVRPQSPQIRMNYACNLLLRGDFAQGLAEYEWRRAQADNPSRRNFGKPQWDGAELDGRKILLHAEQGIGDTIQFARFIPLVRARGGKIIVECQASIAPVIGSIEGVEQTVPQGQALPDFDVHFPLMSLGLAFAATAQAVPGKVPYVSADTGIVETWKTKLPPPDGTLRVGLVWTGNPKHKNNRIRSCPPAMLTPLAAVPGVSFFSLQKKPDSLPPAMQLADLTEHLTDYAHTTAFLSLLDLVISVDTSVAHLAGAMGKPAWVMLPATPDWRWMLERDDSPWYPTIRLFRQKSAGDWAGVVQRVAAELASTVAGKST